VLSIAAAARRNSRAVIGPVFVEINVPLSLSRPQLPRFATQAARRSRVKRRSTKIVLAARPRAGAVRIRTRLHINDGAKAAAEFNHRFLESGQRLDASARGVARWFGI
jgi:hypothetical protein